MGLGGLFKGLVKVGAPVAGAILGGPAGFAIGSGVSSALGANDKARADAAQQTALLKNKRDTEQGALTRRAKKLAVLLRLMEQGAKAKPGRYGGLDFRSAYGAIPGLDTGYEARDFVLPEAPVIRGGQNDLLAGLMGGIAGIGGYLGNREAADNDVQGRIGAASSPAGRAIGATNSNPFGVGASIPGLILDPRRRITSAGQPVGYEF